VNDSVQDCADGVGTAVATKGRADSMSEDWLLQVTEYFAGPYHEFPEVSSEAVTAMVPVGSATR
jgi:hypothetical protein